MKKILLLLQPTSNLLLEDVIYNDKLLFARIAEGDENAFRQIFEQYVPAIHPFVRDIVKSDPIASEIVQEVFLKLWLKREHLLKSKNLLPGYIVWLPI